MATTTITGKLSRRATRPTWAEVSLSRLRQNFRTLQKHVGKDVTVCAVVKANAYGHGAVECAAALQAEGAQWLGVTSLDEAIPLRDAEIRSRILLMTGFWPGEEEEIVTLRLTPIVWEPWHIESLNRASAKITGGRHPVHLKIDSGMGRQGVNLHALPRVLDALKCADHVLLEGVCTHLASSEVLDASSAAEQIKNFDAAMSSIRSAGIAPPLAHVANTAATISRRVTWNNMVRPGLSLYGYNLPFQSAGREVSSNALRLDVKPVLTWKTRILTLRDMKANQALGYGGTYVTKSASRIALLPVGYADGVNRALSSCGRVLVRNHYAPIVGLISMDLTMIDVTGIAGVEVGDEVILLGSSDGLTVSAQEHADLVNTIPYEILCAISKRVPRRYTA